jgi:hypothetical protein
MSNTVKNAKIYLLAFLIFLGSLVVVIRFAYIQLFGRTAYIERVVDKVRSKQRRISEEALCCLRPKGGGNTKKAKHKQQVCMVGKEHR